MLSLYQALIAFPTRSGYDLDSIEPTTFFSSRSKSGFLRQEDVLRYEIALKGVVTGPLVDDSAAMEGVLRVLKDPHLANFGPDILNRPPSTKCFKNKLITLVADLHHNNQLVGLLSNQISTY